MDYLTLASGLPPSSRLGFGCGGVMGRAGRAQSLRAIAAALDGGITHFDVARLYGYGEAEALVGEALKGRRDRVVIASKFGLTAPRAAGALKALKPVAQQLAARIPGARRVMRALVGGAVEARDRFSVAAAQAALDQSLAALKTDYLDIWFLHDCAADDLTDELLGFLDAQRAAGGKIRAYGVAGTIDVVTQIYPARGAAMLYQFPSSLTDNNAERLPADRRRFIAHSPFARAALLAGIVPGGDIHPLMLGHALAAANVAVVLCSMLDGAHLAANLAAIETPRFATAEMTRFAARLAPAASRASAA